MKGKILAGLILTGVICFSGTAFAAQVPNVPKISGNTPSVTPDWNVQPPANNNDMSKQRPPVPPGNDGNSKVKPPVPPSNNVKPPVPPANSGNSNVKPPELPTDFKPGDIQRPQLNK